MRIFAAALIAVAVIAFAGACGEKPKPAPVAPKVEPPKVAPKVVVPPKPPALTPDQQTRLDADFKTAGALVADADKLLADGKALLAKDGAEAANATFVQAKKKYQQALQTVDKWIESENNEVTQGQIDFYLGSYRGRVNGWQKAQGSIPKLHD